MQKIINSDSKVKLARERLGLDGPANPKERHAFIKSIGKANPKEDLDKRAIMALGLRFAPTWLRLEILERDNYQCRYCGTKVTNENANIDHLKPWPYGMTEKSNLVTSCRPCNQQKGRSESLSWQRRTRRTPQT